MVSPWLSCGSGEVKLGFREFDCKFLIMEGGIVHIDEEKFEPLYFMKEI